MTLAEKYANLANLGVIDNVEECQVLAREATGHALDLKQIGHVAIVALDDGSFFLAQVGARRFGYAPDATQLVTRFGAFAAT